MLNISPKLSEEDLISTPKVGVIKSASIALYGSIWWSFSILELHENCNMRSKFSQFEMDNQFVYCLHVKKVEKGLWVSLFRRCMGEKSSPVEDLKDLNVDLVFLDVEKKPRKIMMESNSNCINAWYEKEFPIYDFHKCTIECKIFSPESISWMSQMQSAMQEKKLNFDPFGDFLGTSYEDLRAINSLVASITRYNESLDPTFFIERLSQKLLKYICEFEKLSRVPKFKSLEEALNVHKASIHFGLPRLTDLCCDYISRKIDRDSCVYILKQLRGSKLCDLFNDTMDCFSFHFEDISTSNDWRYLKEAHPKLSFHLLKEGTCKKFNGIDCGLYLKEMNSIFNSPYMESDEIYSCDSAGSGSVNYE